MEVQGEEEIEAMVRKKIGYNFISITMFMETTLAIVFISSEIFSNSYILFLV